jgi:hypothetical protein
VEEPPRRAADRPLGLLDGHGQRCGVGGCRAGERERLLECLLGRFGGVADPEFGDRLAGKVAELFAVRFPWEEPMIWYLSGIRPAAGQVE